MRVAVVGVGHVGLVTAACLARWGHEVVGMDDDERKVATLRSRGLPFHEPGLADLVEEGCRAGRLRFTGDISEALSGADVAFVSVGTPSLAGGAPNLAFVERVGQAAARHADGDLVLVEKSTVPANTGIRLRQVIQREQARHRNGARIDVASNPEFLREGQAVVDTLRPDRVVVGTDSERAAAALRAVYRPLLDEADCAYIETDLVTAELIKHASNAYLATRISFINAVARICELVGADVEVVAQGMGHDHRIGPHFLKAGMGYGGSCFPKDVDAFLHLARSVGYDFGLLDEVRKVNHQMRELVLDKLRAELWHLEGKTVAVLGAAFKPGTDDLRQAPAIWLAEQLLEAGATVRVYDPVALAAVKEQLPQVECVDDPLAACRDAHAAVVCTEWHEIARLDARRLAATLGYPIVVDGRNALDPAAMRAAGIQYHAVGRPARATDAP
ncbi:MAG TPA: UDP-glucose/GDP-mannose dehydrogenase family protein [Nitriliruptorales bacterium]|nr:UDP-glucose/GDP-mannose dehydrogenase family protein [Nitriliruptorales bacterium]